MKAQFNERKFRARSLGEIKYLTFEDLIQGVGDWLPSHYSFWAWEEHINFKDTNKKDIYENDTLKGTLTKQFSNEKGFDGSIAIDELECRVIRGKAGFSIFGHYISEFHQYEHKPDEGDDIFDLRASWWDGDVLCTLSSITTTGSIEAEIVIKGE